MKHYIIDGNNLMGKIKEVSRIQQKDKQGSRVKLAYLVDNYFAGKNVKVTTHFDGFAKEPIKPSKIKIIYSDNKSADEKIKDQIGSSKNSKNLVVVTSDNNLAQFASVCSCTVIPSEQFAASIRSRKVDDEISIIDDLKKNASEFEKLFGVNDD